jgi:hypothetical protein
MSETYLQQAFGQPTFTDVHASGNSSGHDLLDILDADNLYHNNEYRPGVQHLQPLHIPSQDEIAQNQHFAYALHSSGVSAPGKRNPSIYVYFIILHVLHSQRILVSLIRSFACEWTLFPCP